MRLLITGATGFFGRHLLQALAQAPSALGETHVWVRQLASWTEASWTAGLGRVRPIVGPLAAADLLRDAPAGLDAVVHLAASVHHSRRGAQQVAQVNVEGALAAAELALARRCRLIVMSTSGTVGCSRRPEAAPDEAAAHCTEVVRHWPYYSSKVAMEQQLLALQATRGLQLVLVRPPMLLGPGDHRGRATSQIRRFMRKPLPFILAGGIHYIDIRDAAQAVRRLLELEKPRPIYHLRGTACTLSDFFADLEVVCQRSAPRRRLPWGLAWSLAQADVHLGVGVRGRPFGLLPDPVVIEMARHYWDVSSTFAEADLNYCSRPKLETLQDTVNDLRQSAV